MKQIYAFSALLLSGVILAQTGADITGLVKINNVQAVGTNRILVTDGNGNLGYRVANNITTSAVTLNGAVPKTSISKTAIFRNLPNISSNNFITVDDTGNLGYRNINFVSTSNGNLNGTIGLSATNLIALGSILNQQNNYNYAVVVDSNGVLGKRPYSDIIPPTGSATVATPKTRYIASTDWASTVYQGKINNSNRILKVKIPYSSGTGTYSAYSTSISVTGQGGDTNTLTLSYPAGTFANSGTIVATIVVSGSDNEFLVKRQGTLNEELIATIPINLGGQTVNYTMIAIGGVPDKKFLENDDHIFLYRPVTGDDGRTTWLNLNLGAKYSDSSFDNDDFNPKQQASSLEDYMAYGSLIQWGRPTDGHELIDWTSSTAGTARYNLGWYDSNTQQMTYAYDPCPTNYRTPTISELESLRTQIESNSTGTGANKFYNSPLKFVLAGDRHFNGGTFENQTLYGTYWSSDPDSNQATAGQRGARALWISKDGIVGIYSSTVTYGNYFYARGDGFPVRCIKP